MLAIGRGDWGDVTVTIRGDGDESEKTCRAAAADLLHLLGPRTHIFELGFAESSPAALRTSWPADVEVPTVRQLVLGGQAWYSGIGALELFPGLTCLSLGAGVFREEGAWTFQSRRPCATSP